MFNQGECRRDMENLKSLSLSLPSLEEVDHRWPLDENKSNGSSGQDLSYMSEAGLTQQLKRIIEESIENDVPLSVPFCQSRDVNVPREIA